MLVVLVEWKEGQEQEQTAARAKELEDMWTIGGVAGGEKETASVSTAVVVMVVMVRSAMVVVMVVGWWW